jgi:hypothetical protein
MTDDGDKPDEYLQPGQPFPETPNVEPAPRAGEIVTGDDAPILPAVEPEAALAEAVGKPTRKRRRPVDDRDNLDEEGEPLDPEAKRRSRRTIVIATLSILAGLSAAALVFLGRANAQRYLIACGSSRVTAEQGRGFPPWGSHPMAGPEWKAITLPSNAECKPRETDDETQLGAWYLELLMERATTTLTSRTLLDPVPAANGVPASNPLDTVAEQLEQALLLARSPDRRDQRKEIERLQGDVDYWRASLRLRDASTVLADAAKQFDAAAAQRPRHVSDAAAWATFLRKLSDELRAGPNAQPTAQFPPVAVGSGAPPAPAGVALPVEPESSGAGSAAPPPAPDAGVPSGGVLL